VRASRRTTAAIAIVSVLLAVEIVRLTVAGAFAESGVGVAQKLAPRTPPVLVSEAMAEVGEAAARGGMPPPSAIKNLRHLVPVAPLRVEPLLVEAAIAQKAGELERAERLLLEARRRNPRSAAARFLLAQGWLAEGRIEDGLAEMAILSRLLPGSTAQLAPALSQYAQTPGAGARLKTMIEANPRLKGPLLNALAADPDNLPLVLELQGAAAAAGIPESTQWQGTAFTALVANGEYERAYALWRRLSGYNGPRPLLFNGGFQRVSAPPPFNWSFNSTGGGVADPGDGRMRVIYYGREHAVLASQLLLLPPGTYSLSVAASGTAAPGALAWQLSCLPGNKALMVLRLSQSSARGRFEVPGSGCEAQMLELRGEALDMPQDSDLLVGPIAIHGGGR